MLEEQIIPRLLARSGAPASIHLKRFHSYGLGESHVDQLLAGVEALVRPDGSVKLGFRAHYPQIETKLTVRGADMDDIARKLAPVEAEVRKRLGNFILAEDDQTLEGVVLAALAERRLDLAVVETFTGGQIAARIAPSAGRGEGVPPRHRRARPGADRSTPLGLDGGDLDQPRSAEAVAQAARRETGATHALAVLIELDDGPDRHRFRRQHPYRDRHRRTASNPAARASSGGRDWVRLGAVELGLDCLRRYLHGLPVAERTDFEKKP